MWSDLPQNRYLSCRHSLPMPFCLERTSDQRPHLATWMSTIRSQHHRIFIDDEERSVAESITNNSLAPGIILTDATFHEITMMAYPEKIQNNQIPKPFNSSTGLPTGFKKRNQFSSPRSHLNCRSFLGEEQKAAWISRLTVLLGEACDHSPIINVDKSCWSISPSHLQTWTATGP
jgi:hypothetical protein